MRKLDELLRDNILRLSPYSCARNEYSGHSGYRVARCQRESVQQSVQPLPRSAAAGTEKRDGEAEGCFTGTDMFGNGSDEIIDLLFRCFCRPGVDNVVAIEPTYGMYRVCADINDVEYRPVRLDDNFPVF